MMLINHACDLRLFCLHEPACLFPDRRDLECQIPGSDGLADTFVFLQRFAANDASQRCGLLGIEMVGIQEVVPFRGQTVNDRKIIHVAEDINNIFDPAFVIRQPAGPNQ